MIFIKIWVWKHFLLEIRTRKKLNGWDWNNGACYSFRITADFIFPGCLKLIDRTIYRFTNCLPPERASLSLNRRLVFPHVPLHSRRHSLSFRLPIALSNLSAFFKTLISLTYQRNLFSFPMASTLLSLWRSISHEQDIIEDNDVTTPFKLPWIAFNCRILEFRQMMKVLYIVLYFYHFISYNRGVQTHIKKECLKWYFFLPLFQALNRIVLWVVLDVVDNDLYENGHLNDCSVLDKVVILLVYLNLFPWGLSGNLGWVWTMDWSLFYIFIYFFILICNALLLLVNNKKILLSWFSKLFESTNEY